MFHYAPHSVDIDVRGGTAHRAPTPLAFELDGHKWLASWHSHFTPSMD
jgi:hypothetical protein